MSRKFHRVCFLSDSHTITHLGKPHCEKTYLQWFPTYRSLLQAIEILVRKMRYRKVPKFLDARKNGCNLPKIQTKRPNLSVFRQKDANGIANSEDTVGAV